VNRLAPLALLAVVWAAPAAAQTMDPSMPGMNMSPGKPAPTAAKKTPTAGKKASAGAHAMTSMPGMVMSAAPSDGGSAAHDTSSTPTKTSLPDDETSPSRPQKPTAVGPGAGAEPPMGAPPLPDAQAPPPPVPTDFAADRYYDAAAMAAARALLHREHGGDPNSMVMANLLEYQGKAGGGYRWDGGAWFGGDIDRFVVKSEGDGSRRDGLEAAEVQALYSHAIGPYFNLQAGLRQDFKPTPQRTFATVGVEGLAPYWFDIQGALFLSTKGELLGRAESTYDLRLTQRLILQPRVELNFSAQNVREIGLGSGLTNAELGLRLRYEIRREFAPYIGVSYDRKLGGTADFARAAGHNPGGASVVAGVRAWF
jgi:copper resistance protein B